jgi:L-threonylcarbamoyladenylate synthase
MKSTCLSWSDQKDRKKLVGLIGHGGVVVGPSDTVIGLLANATQQGVVALDTIKKRSGKPYIILINEADKIGHYAQIPHDESVKKLINECWPGPLTLLLKAKEGVRLYPQDVATIALRIPAHQGLLDILAHFSGLLSTSANLAGDPIPTSMEEVSQDIMENVSGCISATDFTTVPSTIIDCSGDQIVLIREGAYKVKDLEKIVGFQVTKS